MKKFLSLLSVIALAASANATPYKALYVEAEPVPEGAGIVYITTKDAEDDDYVVEKSEDGDEIAYMKWVAGENSNGADYPGCTGGIGMYEVLIQAEPAAGYEVVCVANTIKEDGIYSESDCYAVIHGQNQALGWTFDFDYTNIVEMGVKISVNNPEHPEDGHSENGPSRDAVLEDFYSYVNDEPDAYVYVIFRKKGDELPKFVSEDGNAIQATMADAKDSATFNVAGQRTGWVYKGIAIKNGRKVILK